MLARPVLDRQLGDPEASVVGEHRDEPVQLAVNAHAVHHLRSVGLQAAVEIVQPQPREAARDEVEDP